MMCRGTEIKSLGFTHMIGSPRIEFCLQKAVQCEHAAASATGEHIQALYRVLAEQWRETARGIEALEQQQRGPMLAGQFGVRKEPGQA
jgi:hypothetical protein